jgi:RimJ/RimL family protein N-acetyltransferase
VPRSESAAAGARNRADLETERLLLVELEPGDADEMVGVLADEDLYAFIGGRPPTVEELRKTYRRLSRGLSADRRQEWRNWILRRRNGRRAVGTVQATIVGEARTALVAWIVGKPWQGHGYATEAVRAVVAWLDIRGVETIDACVHPDHLASAAVAARAGLEPTNEFIEGERVWRRTQPFRNPVSAPTTD